MPGITRPAGATAKAIWEYTNRFLTSLAIPDDIIKFLGKGTGTVVPDNKSLFDLIVLDRLDHSTYGLSALRTLIAAIPTDPALAAYYTATRAGFLDNINNPQLLNLPNVSVMEHEIEFPSAEALDDIALTGEQTTTERTILVGLPTGATIRRVSLIALITAMNNTANAQKIDITVQGRKGAGSWSDFFSQDDVIGFPAEDGATTDLVAVQDISALVDEAMSYGFRVSVNQSVAESVRYTTQYILAVIYRMGPSGERITNGRFETGDFPPWEHDVYGYALIGSDYPRSGSYACKLTGSGWISQDLADPVPSEQLVGTSVFGFYAGNDAVYYFSLTFYFRVTLTYTDDSTTTVDFEWNTIPDQQFPYQYVNLKPYVEAGKTLKSIKIERLASQEDVWIDDVTCYV
jgi:hypothetical protein